MISVRLLFAIVVLVFVSSLGSGIAVYRKATGELIRAQEQKFLALMQVRQSELAEYLDSVREETRFWARNRIMRQALLEFTAAWKQLEGDPETVLQRLYIEENPYPTGAKDNLEFAPDGSEYSAVHARYHYWLRTFLLHRGVYDVFLLDRDGNLVYTSFKEYDYATNLLTGRWKETDLGRAFRVVRDNQFPSFVTFFDFAAYEPSHGTPASFTASPVLADEGTFLGMLAFQIPAARINDIMQATAGMGESGETYVVGEDLLMRSDSRFSAKSTTLETTVDTETVHLALAGRTGLQTTLDYRGIPVLSAYGPLEFEGTTWSVMSEIDESEVLEPTVRLRRFALLAGAGVAVLVSAALVGLALFTRHSERARPR
jgi:methyl-accepting chemotaxis protein